MLASILKKIGIKTSLHDPRWGHNPKGEGKAQEGRRPGEGPPDLDQLWRDFNARLNRLFGQRGSGGDGKFSPDMRGAGITASVVIFIAALIWLASGAFIVQDGQVGVVTTFGELSHTVKPGFNWRWPYPIQAHEIVNVGRKNTAEIGYRSNVRNRQPQESLMLTDDQNLVDVQFSVEYQIKDPVAWLYSERDQDETLREVAESAAREVVGRMKMETVLYDGRDKIAGEVQGITQNLVDRYKLGIQVSNVTMQSVQPPEQVQAAFSDAVKAGEDAARLKSEGEAYASEVLPKARGKAAVLLQDAQAYRAKVVEQANGHAARFDQVVAQYAKAPAVTRERMYIDTMQQIYSDTSKVMVDTKGGNNTIYLPLDKLMTQSAANDAAIGSKSGVQMPPQQPQQAQPQQAQGQPQQQRQAAPAQEAPQPLESVRQQNARSRESQRDRETR